MKKYFETFWVYIISLCLASLFVILTTSQTRPPTSKQLPVTDSTAVISKRDMQQFLFLYNKIPHDQYAQIEAVLNELWNWKSKQLADTTKNK